MKGQDLSAPASRQVFPRLDGRSLLQVSMAPHIHSGASVRGLMVHNLIGLLPIVFAGWFYFGWNAVQMVLIASSASVVTEAVWQRAIGREVTIRDGSAVVTGVLLGLLITPDAPWWIPALGGVVANLVAKQFYGGLGQNPFSTVLVGWAFMFISYSTVMGLYPMPEPKFLLEPGGYLEYSPLDVFKLDGPSSVSELPFKDLFLGNVPGTAGTTSVLAVLLGGIYLLLRRVITWHIPVCFLVGAWVFGFIFWMIDPDVYADPTFHLLSGWMFLGAFFLAGERGTAPVTLPGMIIYGLGCGALTMTIRIWGAYVEGVPFAILLMNTLTPLLDRLRPRPVGRVKARA